MLYLSLEDTEWPWVALVCMQMVVLMSVGIAPRRKIYVEIAPPSLITVQKRKKADAYDSIRKNKNRVGNVPDPSTPSTQMTVGCGMVWLARLGERGCGYKGKG